MNKIISIKQKFLCKDCEYILEISRLKVKKAKQYGGVYCPRCGKKIMDNEIKIVQNNGSVAKFENQTRSL